MASPFSPRTKIGPKSRVQPRFVGKRRKSTRARSTPAFLRMRLACACWTRELTRMRTTSPGASLRTISPYTQEIGGNFPGQSVTLCGQPIQVAACGSHSAGMRTRLVSEEPVLNAAVRVGARSEEHTSELQSRFDLVCRLLLEKKKQKELSGIQWSTSSQNRLDQLYAQDEMLAYQQEESAALVASIIEISNVYPHQPVSEILRD